MIVLAAVTLVLLAPQQKKDPDPATTKEAMQRIQRVVGEWRCAGAPESSKEAAWSEQASWAFKIEKGEYALELAVKDGRLIKSAIMSYDLKEKVYRLAVTPPDGPVREYEGAFQDKDLVLENVGPKDADRERYTFSLLRENRYLVIIERRRATARSWSQAYTVSCTKEGVPFVKAQGPKCVVTGGAGTISVQVQGQTYYVC